MTILAFVCLVILFRLCLAFLVKGQINHQLAQMSGYTGHIDGIGLSLWRGAYQIEGIKIEKKEGKAPIPFFSAPWLDIGLEWKALFHGHIVASVSVEKGQLNFVSGPDQSKSQSGKGEDWQKVLESLVPLKINRFILSESEIHFRDPYGKPPVDVHLEGLNLLAENLSSRQEDAGASLGSISASARAMTDAKLILLARINPFAKSPTFDYSFTLKELKLTALNPMFLRYAGIDVADGAFDLYSEAAAVDGKFKGYFKPMIKNLTVMKPGQKLTLVKWIKKMLAATLGWVFKNDKGKVATKFEFEGEFKNPQTSLWQAAGYLFKNAFVQALPARLEGAIKVEDLQKKDVLK